MQVEEVEEGRIKPALGGTVVGWSQTGKPGGMDFR